MQNQSSTFTASIARTIKNQGFVVKAKLWERYLLVKYRHEMDRDKQEIVKDLAEYAKSSPEEALSKIKAGGQSFREEWKMAKPEKPDEILKFYETSKWLIYDLAQYNYFHNFTYVTRREIANRVKGRVLDYGGGIGTLSLMFAERGLKDITHYDVPGVTMKFVKWRCRKRGLNVNVVGGSETEDRLSGLYDTIVSFEVIEHVKNPKLHIARLAEHLARDGKLYITSSFSADAKDSYHFRSDRTLPELLRDTGLSPKHVIWGMWLQATKSL